MIIAKLSNKVWIIKKVSTFIEVLNCCAKFILRIILTQVFQWTPLGSARKCKHIEVPGVDLLKVIQLEHIVGFKYFFKNILKLKAFFKATHELKLTMKELFN